MKSPFYHDTQSTSDGRKYIYVQDSNILDQFSTEALMMALTSRLRKDRLAMTRVASNLMDEIEHQLIGEIGHILGEVDDEEP